MAVAVLLCAQCGSHRVDVNGWQSAVVARLRCSSCGHSSAVSGFTVGRVYKGDEASLVAEAIEDAALPIAVGAR